MLGMVEYTYIAVVRSGSQVLAFWSADPLLQRWRQSVAIQLPEGWEAYNTDVTPAEQVGKTTGDAPPSAGVFVAVCLRRCLWLFFCDACFHSLGNLLVPTVQASCHVDLINLAVFVRRRASS